MLITERPQLSAEVRAVQAELLRRGVVVLDEDHDPRSRRRLIVASYRQEWAEEAVPELLRGWEVEWAGRTPREIMPARIVAFRNKGMGLLRVYVSVDKEEHLDEVIVAADDEKIVGAAYVCTPAIGTTGPREIQHANVYVEPPLNGRPLIDRFSGEVLENESALDT